MNYENSKRESMLAQEIRNYLNGHPDAADTLGGIAKWWLTRRQYTHRLDVVQRALDRLVEEGVLTKRQLRDGRNVYASVKRHTDSDDQ